VFIADGNELLLECDYRAIEAQLVGYEAIAADGEAGIAYIRLAKLGVHDFLNAHILQRNGKITEADVPQLKWSDDDLRGALKVIKRKFPNEREAAKRIVHGTSYGATAGKVYQLYPEYFSSKPEVGKLKQVFYEVCPAVPKWQKYTVARAGKEGHLRNPFGYLHRFWDVLQWKRDPDGEWRQSWADGAKAALAFGPQSTAAAIIKEAMLRMRERALNGQMRLQVHDSLLFGLNQRGFEEHAQDIIDTMQQPVVELKLPDGSLLSIEVEAKVGRNWGSMEDLGS
jgi:DNA polymerase I-like protein with 3'-5' exonuclease and polymerase domains